MHSNTKTAKRRLLSALALSLALVATTSAVHAAGFAIYENDARGFAMGGANIGRSDDAAALYSNPAGITQLPGLQIKAGLSLIQPSVDVTTYGHIEYAGGLVNGQPGLVPSIVGTEAKNTSMNDYTEVVPHLYATYRLNDDMAVGLGVFVPYGLKSDFDSTWAGAYNNYYTSIKTVEIAPTFAYRIVHDQPWAKQISIAAGVAIINIDADIRKMVALGATQQVPNVGAVTPAAQMILQGDTWEYGYNLAIQWEVNEKVGFGLVYRSGFKAKISDADAKLVANPTIGFAGQSGNTAWGKLDLPDSWTFGVNYSPVAPLNLGIQATRTNWSSYENLTIQAFPGAAGALGAVNVYEKDWNDVWRYSVGAEYQVNNALALRGGIVIDKDPVNNAHADYMVPSNDRQILSVGLGWTLSKTVTLDFAAAYLKIKSTNIEGRAADKVLPTYMHTGHALIFSVSGNFRF